MSIRDDTFYQRALRRYAAAVEEKAFEGTIPYLSDDREEQEALDAAHQEINNELARSSRLLAALIDRRLAKAASGVREASIDALGQTVCVYTTEQVHAIEDAAARRALEYAARRVADRAARQPPIVAEGVVSMITDMTGDVWRFRADSQGEEPEA